MSTKLQLAQFLRQEAQIPGITLGSPSSTVGQTGELLRLVTWIDRVYEDIQRISPYWNFLRAEFEKTGIISGTQNYSATTLGFTDFKNWHLDDMRIWLTATGATDEQEIFYRPWEEFRRVYRFGSARTQSGRPSEFTIKPDKTISFWPVPDASYTLAGEYFKVPDTMTADSDTPVWQDRDFDIIIMWKALLDYARDYVEPNKEDQAIEEYDRLLANLKHEYLPKMTWGEPLA